MQIQIDLVEKGSPIGGRSLLQDVALPAAVVLAAPLANNLAWMQDFAERHGARLAPHGKTTMTPALFRRQLAAGAWGITLATATQCTAAFEHGVSRLLMANQLVGAANMELAARLIRRGADYYCLVDSIANVEALNGYFAERGLTLQVLLELGISGGRTGVRTEAEAMALAAKIAALPALRLCGVEGYEGLIHTTDAARDIRAYAERLVALARALREAALLHGAKPIVTAAGSQWFDLIAEAFQRHDLVASFTPLLRPGCYVTHDHRLYRDAMRELKLRQPDLVGGLQPALAVFARIQSLPEPGTAIVAMGKRDVSCDPDLPLPLQRYRAGRPPRPCTGARVRGVMDQHTLMEIDRDDDVAIGDIICFGTSHPCLTFDKWRQVLLVNDRLEVIEVMPTCF
ncbi:MAG TPA: alanine racemase [Rhodanobacteraceae bacterium]|nr:alanine racemase [Rhodanobacteraceae bacterium]